MKKMIYAVMAFAAIAATSCGKAQEAAESVNEVTEAASDAAASATETFEAATGNGVTELSDDNALRPDTKVAKLTVVDFNATWCGPCKMLAPVFEQAAEKFAGKVDFVSVDIDKCTATANAFSVQAVPTVVILRPDGKSVSYVGTQDLLPAEKFEKIVSDNL